MLGDERLSFHAQLTVAVGDSDYAQPAFLAAQCAHPDHVSLVRSRCNRIYYRRVYRSAQETGGPPVKPKDAATWGAADETARLP